jgi:DNA-binding response OmpR family regulator
MTTGADAALRAEVEHLKWLLGLRDEQAVTLGAAIRLQPQTARVLALLYATRRWLARDWIISAVGDGYQRAEDRSDNYLGVHMTYIRRKLGAGAIECYGRGDLCSYRLTDYGRSRIAAAMPNPELTPGENRVLPKAALGRR